MIWEMLAAAAAEAIPVKSTTGALTAAGIWTGLVSGAIMATVAWIKRKPRLVELENARRKDDLSDLRARIVALEAKVEEANKHADAAIDQAHQANIKLVGAINAFHLVAGYVAGKEPDNPILAQAKELMAIAATGDFGMDAALRKLAATRGVGE